MTDVLIVEDDDSIAQLLEFMMRREGFEVQTCRDGRDAERRIVEGAPPPALVVMDVMLPYTDGFELLALLRRQPLWRDVPVLMLSAKSQEHDIVRAIDAGSSGYVVKPFQPRELMARVRNLLRHAA
ncbi:MAG: response regulator transcription factor [Burkholderiales bacterium]|nr:response regulator transcription factor [Burkholderiales bacterium]